MFSRDNQRRICCVSCSWSPLVSISFMVFPYLFELLLLRWKSRGLFWNLIASRRKLHYHICSQWRGWVMKKIEILEFHASSSHVSSVLLVLSLYNWLRMVRVELGEKILHSSVFTRKSLVRWLLYRRARGIMFNLYGFVICLCVVCVDPCYTAYRCYTIVSHHPELIRGSHLVHRARLHDCHQRRVRLLVWFLLRSNTTHQIESKEDVGRFHRRRHFNCHSRSTGKYSVHYLLNGVFCNKSFCLALAIRLSLPSSCLSNSIFGGCWKDSFRMWTVVTLSITRISTSGNRRLSV